MRVYIWYNEQLQMKGKIIYYYLCNNYCYTIKFSWDIMRTSLVTFLTKEIIILTLFHFFFSLLLTKKNVFFKVIF